MSQKGVRQSALLPVLGLILLVLPVFTTIRWITMSIDGPTNHADLVAEFLSIFPTLLRDANLLTVIEIVFSGSALAVGLAGRQGLRGGGRLVSIMVSWLGGLLTVWLLFSMM